MVGNGIARCAAYAHNGLSYSRPVLVASARSAWESVDVGADNQEDEPGMMEVVVMRVVWDSPTDTGHVRSEDCHHATTHDRFSFIGFTVHASRNSTRVLVHNLWRWLHPTWCGIIVSARMNVGAVLAITYVRLMFNDYPRYFQDRNTSHDKETDPLIYIDDPSYALIPVAKRLARENIASLAQNILDPLMFREENLTVEMSSTNLLTSMTYASSISVSSTSSSVSPYTVSSSHRAAIALADPHRPWRPLESLRVACRTIGVHAFMVRIMDAEKATGDRGLVLKAVSECDSSTLSATGTSSVTLRMYVIDWPEPGRTAANANYDVRKVGRV